MPTKKPIRTEKLPEWWKNSEEVFKEPPKDNRSLEEKKREIDDLLKQLDEPSIDEKKQAIEEKLKAFREA